MMMMAFCGPSRDTSDRFFDRYFHSFPCLSDPARRSTLCLQLTLVMLHLVFISFIFIFYPEFIEKLKKQPRYILVYLLLFAATLVQYVFTAGSSPGYVLDAMRDFARADASLRSTEISNKDNLLQAKMAV